MKKTDLYRGFDSIKPGKELKAEILKAVKERDKVTVIKRPLFVPIMVGMLVCLNFGMVAKLIISNKSQINMADFRARTSISQAPEASQEDFVLIEDTRISDFQSTVDQLQEGIDNGEYCLVYEWQTGMLVDISLSCPYYLTQGWYTDYKGTDENLPESGAYIYRRYAKRRSVKVQSDSDFDVSDSIGCLTNDEMIVVYNGGITPDNIVSITCSNVDTSAVSDDQLAEILEKLNTNDVVNNSLENYVLMRSEDYASEERITLQNCLIESNLCIYPVESSGDKAHIFQCCIFQMSTSDEIKRWGNEIDEMLFVTEEGDIVDKNELEYLLPNAYWKETLYSPDFMKNDMVVVPDVIGMDIDEAKKALEDAGLKLNSFRYVAPYSVAFKYGQVMDLDCWNQCYSAKAGTVVPRGTEVDLRICAESAIWSGH